MTHALTLRLWQTPVAIALCGGVILAAAPHAVAAVELDAMAVLNFDLAPHASDGGTPSDVPALRSPASSSGENRDRPAANPTPPPDLPELSRTNRLPIPPNGASPPVATGRSRTFAKVPPAPEIPVNAGIIARNPVVAQAPSVASPSADRQTTTVAIEPAPTQPPRAPAIATKSLAELPQLAVEFAIPSAPTIPVLTAATAAAGEEQLVAQAAASQGAVALTTPTPVKSLEAMAQGLNRQRRTSWLFAGGSQSLVARAIGHAEGTRTANGGYTSAYNGHRDPGNGKHNLGTFSYQHGGSSPEDADRRQLARLQRQHQDLLAKANAHQLQLTVAEELNALDLANQSPRAALSHMGYMDRLAQAYDMGLRDHDAVLWARTRSFTDPDTGRWNASGFNHDGDRIISDQDRRIRAIAAVLRSDQIPIPITPVTPKTDPNAVADLGGGDRATRRSESTTLPSVATGINLADSGAHPLFSYSRANQSNPTPTNTASTDSGERDDSGNLDKSTAIATAPQRSPSSSSTQVVANADIKPLLNLSEPPPSAATSGFVAVTTTANATQPVGESASTVQSTPSPENALVTQILAVDRSAAVKSDSPTTHRDRGDHPATAAEIPYLAAAL